jgi:hypothetical protein
MHYAVVVFRVVALGNAVGAACLFTADEVRTDVRTTRAYDARKRLVRVASQRLGG